MSVAKKVHNYLLTQRELDLDTLQSRIVVDMDYCDYVQEIADELGMDAVDCLDAVEELAAREKICFIPEMHACIDYIEVYD